MSAPSTPPGVLGLRIAACVAGLLLAAGLIVRVSVALSPGSPEAGGAIGAPADAVALSTDVTGRPLFDGVELAPDRPVEACIAVRTHATRDVGPLGLFMTGFSGSAAMADALLVVVEEGPPAGDCAGFAPERVVVEGHLGAVLGAHGDGARAARPADGTTAAVRWYRIRITLPADAPAEARGGRIDRLDLAWTTLPIDEEPGDRERQLAFAMGVAQRTVLPLLLMLVLSVLFLGVQDRVDRREPKLADAPDEDELLPFG
jgi:hypothetical protein